MKRMRLAATGEQQKQHSIIEKWPPFLIALLCLLLGAFIQRGTVDLSNSLGRDSFTLLNLFQGGELPATFMTFLIARIGAFFALWGFLKEFRQKGYEFGGLCGAILLAIHPIFASNNGRFGLFLWSLALFWWLLYFSHFIKKLGFLLPTLTAAIGGIFLSVWMLVLTALLFCFLFEKWKPSKTIGLGNRIVILVTFCFYMTIFSLPGLEEWRNTILTYPKAWLRYLLTCGLSLQYLYSWGAGMLLGISFISTLFFYPTMLVSLIVICGVILGGAGLDLSGVLFLWVILCTLTGMMFDKGWHYLIQKKSIFLPNVLVLSFIMASFHLWQDKYIYAAMSAPSVFRSEFLHQCGEVLSQPEIWDSSVLKVTSENSDSKSCFAAFGNYHRSFPGRYRVTVYACHVGHSPGLVDINVVNKRTVFSRNALPVGESFSDCRPFPTVSVKYNTSPYPFMLLEHRIYYGGEGILYFDRVEVEAL